MLTCDYSITCNKNRSLSFFQNKGIWHIHFITEMPPHFSCAMEKKKTWVIVQDSYMLEHDNLRHYSASQTVGTDTEVVSYAYINISDNFCLILICFLGCNEQSKWKPQQILDFWVLHLILDHWFLSLRLYVQFWGGVIYCKNLHVFGIQIQNTN